MYDVAIALAALCLVLMCTNAILLVFIFKLGALIHAIREQNRYHQRDWK